MNDNMDLNAGTVVTEDETIEVGELLFEEVCEVMSKKLSKAEILGHHEFGINRI